MSPSHLRGRLRPARALIAGALALAGATAVPAAAHAWSAGPVVVSPSGDDAAPGTLLRPVRTPERARDIARARLAAGAPSVQLLLGGGTYRLDRPLTLDARDAGERWSALPGRRPVLSGARPITGWRVVDAQRDLWSAPVPAGLQTRQLHVDGRRAVRARTAGLGATDGLPAGSVKTATGYTVPGDALQSYARPQELELVFDTFKFSWSATPKAGWIQSRCGVASISGTPEQTEIEMREPCWSTLNNLFVARPTLPSRLENAVELLDAPGEWARDGDRLLYIPRPGEQMASATVTAPALEALVTGDGVRDLTFSGITFADTTWMKPSGPDGLPIAQANFALRDPEASLHWQSAFVSPEGGESWNGHPFGATAQKMPAAVDLDGASDVRFVGNRFTRIGQTGLDLDAGARDSAIVGNVFRDISGSAVQVGGVTDPNQSDPELVDERVRIENNVIRDIANEYQSGVGIFLGYTRDVRVAHNDIAELPYTAISLGWGWGSLDTLPTVAGGNVVEANRIDRIMLAKYDGGGVYTIGPQPGSVMRGNWITNQHEQYGALYVDQGSSGWLMEDNVLASVRRWMHANPNAFDPEGMVARGNFTDTEAVTVGKVTIEDLTLVTDGRWPLEARRIQARAGLQPLYRLLLRAEM
jgi:hypothetical protein